MVSWIKNYLLEQEIKRNPKITKQFIAWDKVQSAVIVTDSSRLNTVSQFVKQSGRNFDSIISFNDKISLDKNCFLSVNKKDFLISGLPKPEILQKIRSKSFDVLINFDFNNSVQLKALSGLTGARCKVGPDVVDYKSYFDISILSNEAEFLNQALKYLMMIKS